MVHVTTTINGQVHELLVPPYMSLCRPCRSSHLIGVPERRVIPTVFLYLGAHDAVDVDLDLGDEED